MRDYGINIPVMLTRKETWERLVRIGLVQGDMPSERWELSGSYLGESDLSETNLNGANLSGSYFKGANLSEADLRGTDLIEADFSGAILRGTNMNGAGIQRANFNEATLIGAYLSGADLRGADLDRANLSGANLSGADLSGANLNGANISGAHISRAHLRGANLREADLSKANLIGADLLEANLSEANLSEANLTGVDLRETDLNKTICLKANISNSNLKGSKIIDVNLNFANLSGSDITGSIYWRVSTKGWKIDGIKAEYVYFTLNMLEKEKYKRSFEKGQFEALFKFLPTVELIFDGSLKPAELWVLHAILEEIQAENPELGLKMSEIVVNHFQTCVSIKTEKDEFLNKAVRILQEAIEKGVSKKSLLPHIKKILTDVTQKQEFSDLISSFEETLPPEITITIKNPTINITRADGSTSTI